jgi:hypothetical protein
MTACRFLFILLSGRYPQTRQSIAEKSTVNSKQAQDVLESGELGLILLDDFADSRGLCAEIRLYSPK